MSFFKTVGAVNSTGSGGATNAPSAVVPASSDGRNAMMVLAVTSGTAVTSIPAWLSLTKQAANGANQNVYTYEGVVPGGVSGTTVTIGLTAGARWIMVFLVENTAGPAVATSSGNASGTSLTPAFTAATPDADNEAVIAIGAYRDGVSGDSFNATPGSGYTELVDHSTTAAAANNVALYIQEKDLGNGTSGVSQTPGSPTYNLAVSRATITLVLPLGSVNFADPLPSDTQGGVVSFSGKKAAKRGTLFSSTEGGAVAFTGQRVDLQEGFENVANSAAISTSNTIFPSIVGAGTWVEDHSVSVPEGAKASRLSVAAQSKYGEFTSLTPVNGQTRYWRLYIRPDGSVSSGIPSATNAIIIGKFDAVPTVCFDVQWMVTTGFIKLRNSSGVQLQISASPLTVDQWNRIEIEVVPGVGNAGTVTLKAWLGTAHYQNTGTPDFTLTGAITESRVNLLRLGFPTSATVAAYLDGFAMSNTTWVGPTNPAHTGSFATASAEGGVVSFSGAQGVPGLLFQETFDALTPPATVLTSNTGFDTVAHTGSWVATSRQHSAVGVGTYLSCAAQTGYGEKAVLPSNGKARTVRFYLWPDPTVGSGLPSADTNLVVFYQTATTVIAGSLRLLTTGALQLRDSSNVAVATTATGVLVQDQWNRIEVQIVPGSSGTLGMMNLRVWAGFAVQDSVSAPTTSLSTPVDALTEARVNTIRWGMLTSTTWAAWLDDYAISNNGWIGPRATSEAHAQSFTTNNAEGGAVSFTGRKGAVENGKISFREILTATAHTNVTTFRDPMPALSGGGAVSFTAAKGGRRALGALTGGGIITQGGNKQAKRTSLAPNAEGGQVNFLGFRSSGGTVGGAITFREGGAVTFTTKKAARRNLGAITDGWDPQLQPLEWEGTPGYSTGSPFIVLSGGGTVTFTGKHAGTVTVTYTGGGDGHFTPTGGIVATLVRLVLPRGIDDHERPYPDARVSGLWRHFAFPVTQVGLLVYRDGTVIETNTWYTAGYFAADAIIGGGTDFVAPPSDWRVAVLAAAGYQFVPAT